MNLPRGTHGLPILSRGTVLPPLLADSMRTFQLPNGLRSFPKLAQYRADQSADYTTTSTSFTDVDTVRFRISLRVRSGVVLIGFSGVVQNSGTAYVLFDVSQDGARIGGDDGLIIAGGTAAFSTNASFSIARTVTVGVHVFKLQWKTFANTATLYAGAGTANRDFHPIFWVQEIFQ